MAETESNRRVNAFLGTLFLTVAAVLTTLVFADRWTSIDIRFPDIWYRSRNFHVLICLLLYAVGGWAHHCAGRLPGPSPALFRSVKVYSRPDCELCVRAREVLDDFAAALPAIEVIDISGNTLLEQQHSSSVPVVEIDGRVRFRGFVSAELVQRLIDARRRQQRLSAEANASETHGEQNPS